MRSSKGSGRLALLIVIFVCVFCSCGDGSEDARKESSDKGIPSGGTEMQKVPVILYVPGERPRQQDEVLQEIDRVTANELNMELEVNYIPWSDYINLIRLKSTGGEAFDIYLGFFSELSGNIIRKQCLALNGLLDRYGQDLKENIPREYWESLTVDGKIYGIPAVYAMTEMGRGFLVRKDLRLKYNLPEIKDIATYELFLDAIAKNEKDVIPMLGETMYFMFADKSMVGHCIYTLGSDAFQYMYIDIDKKPYRVENFLKTDLFKKLWKADIEARKRGWIEEDILAYTDRDGKFISGHAASMAGDLYNITERENLLRKNVPEGQVELAIINKEGRWINMFPVNNFGMISSTSENPERAVRFMNWLRKSQENYDLFMLGIKGKTYELEGDKARVPAGTDPRDRYNPTPWFTMHMPYTRSWTSDPPAFTEALEFWNSLRPENSDLMSFSYSSESVKAEKAAVEKVCMEEGRPLLTGLLNTERDYEKLLQDLDLAGMPKILEDTQRQVDQYMARQSQ